MRARGATQNRGDACEKNGTADGPSQQAAAEASAAVAAASSGSGSSKQQKKQSGISSSTQRQQLLPLFEFKNFDEKKGGGYFGGYFETKSLYNLQISFRLF